MELHVHISINLLGYHSIMYVRLWCVLIGYATSSNKRRRARENTAEQYLRMRQHY
jgi:hypothetical protein